MRNTCLFLGVMEDFFLRRSALFLARKDHGLPWAKALATIWAEEQGLGKTDAQRELEQFHLEIKHRSAWNAAF